MSRSLSFRTYADRAAASREAAELLAAGVAEDLAKDGCASLVVSGGTSPGDCFDHLSGKSLEWSRVTVVPSDERWVDAGDPDSNERLIRSRLLRGSAAAARLLPLYRPGLEPEQALTAVDRDLGTLPRAFSSVLLGMGADGHFASLFPAFDGLAHALDPECPERCVVVRTAGSPHLRISLTLRTLTQTRQVALLFFGEDKRRVFDAARVGAADYPVAALLGQDRAPVSALWAP